MPLEVQTRYGPIWMDIAKMHYDKHAELGFEKEFINILETDDYDYFIDVGAGWGYFSVVAAYHTANVFAYEPFQPRRKLLVENVENLGLDNIIVSKKAVGTGNRKLYIGGRMVGPHSGVRKDRVEVKWISLKSILNNLQGVRGIIKIDVEGNEIDVVKSAGNLENYTNITWLIERHQRKGYGYGEDVLFEAMKPFKGKLVGSRAWTYHYVFRR